MSLPTVTVVVPARNASAWIDMTLSSLVAQTYPKDRLEIIVVDDGSTDDTVAKATTLLTSSGVANTVLHNASPQGPSAARNRGWRKGRGEWVQFLDADDLLDPSKISVQAHATRDKGADVAVVFSRWGRLACRDSRWTAELPDTEPSIGADPVFDLLRSDNFMATGSQLFRRTWLERVGGYVESYHFIEDVDLLLRIACQGGLVQVVPSAKPLFWYRQRAESLAHSNDRGFIDGCLRNAGLAERYWREREEMTTPRARLLADVYFMGARYYAEHDPEMFLTLTRDISRLAPGFVPTGPAALRLLARILGYPRAERCAVQYRRLKRSVRGTPTARERLRATPEQLGRP